MEPSPDTLLPKFSIHFFETLCTSYLVERASLRLQTPKLVSTSSSPENPPIERSSETISGGQIGITPRASPALYSNPESPKSNTI